MKTHAQMVADLVDEYRNANGCELLERLQEWGEYDAIHAALVAAATGKNLGGNIAMSDALERMADKELRATYRGAANVSAQEEWKYREAA